MVFGTDATCVCNNLFLREHDVAFAGLFGFQARGEERNDSDVDLDTVWKTIQQICRS